MFPYEAQSIARTAFEDRAREATQRRLVREARRALTERPGPVAAEWQARSRARFWRLVHRPHSYG